MIRTCRIHGEAQHHSRTEGGWRCAQCGNDAVNKRRRKIRAILVHEHGGRCTRCGYDKSIAALHFHHRDPSQKDFGVSARGSSRSLAKARQEAAKCDLICANCHAEIHAMETGATGSAAPC